MLYDDIEVEVRQGTAIIELLPANNTETEEVFVKWELDEDGGKTIIKAGINLNMIVLPLRAGLNRIHFSVMNNELDYSVEGMLEIEN